MTPRVRRATIGALGLLSIVVGVSGLIAAQRTDPPSAAPLPTPAPAAPSTVQASIQALLPAGEEMPPELTAGGAPFRAAAGVPCFYRRRELAPAWGGEGGLDSENTGEILAAVEDSTYDGLRPEDYHLAELRRRVDAARTARPDPAARAELDLLLTDAFLNLASDLKNGRVNPRTSAEGCRAEPAAPADPTAQPAAEPAAPAEPDLPAVLESALAARGVRSTLAGLAPQTDAYRTLRLALAFYRGIVARGGWPTVPDGPTLHPGDRGPRVLALRDRLEVSGFLPPATADRDLFDGPLQTAVASFQDRNGLEPDGSVGKGTLASLNVPAEERLRQIQVNLERWRWLPRDLGENHLMVNIAGFLLDAVEDGRSVLQMRVVVGKPYTSTPQFSGNMRYLVLAPYWNVPQSIVTKEIVPHMRRDPGYLGRQGMEVLAARDGSPVDPSVIDWEHTTGAGLAIRQQPGGKNALGRVKFMFPNSYDVYLHDTPSRSLFARAERSFSHGCIRLEKPLDLAAYVLRDKPEWTPEAIRAAAEGSREKVVTLTKPLPVHLAYWTVWVDGAGVVQFRKDIYGRDKPLLEMLSPGSTATSEPSARKAEDGRAAKGAAKAEP